MRVHTVKSTGLHIPPAPIKGTKGPKLQGGLPPVAWRNSWSRASDTGRYARVAGEARTMPDKGW
jgi:hypothetical protein